VETFLFAHQRGRYLANCLRSADAVGWPGPITIIDDGSTDRASRAVLAQAERDGHRVIRQAGGANGAWGGLQRNMGLALELAESRVALFLQDDLQFVRSVTADEIDRMAELVNNPALSPFLNPSFHMESWSESMKQGAFAWDDEHRVHVRTEAHRFQGFSDVAVMSPVRLRAAGWDPQYVEKEASPRAVQMFGPMMSMPVPFIAFLPYPYAPRHHLFRRLRERERRRTPAVLHMMRPAEVELLRDASTSALPFATAYLRLVDERRERLLGTTYWSH
jgi:hypothetical protein